MCHRSLLCVLLLLTCQIKYTSSVSNLSQNKCTSKYSPPSSNILFTFSILKMQSLHAKITFNMSKYFILGWRIIWLSYFGFDCSYFADVHFSKKNINFTIVWLIGFFLPRRSYFSGNQFQV